MPYFLLWLIMLMGFGFPSIGLTQENDIQAMINDAMEGDTIFIPEGNYQGPLLISKPLNIQGNGRVMIRSQGDEPAFTINTNQVTISNVQISQEGSTAVPAIWVEGDYNSLKNLAISTSGMGIKLIDSSHNHLANIEIQGHKPPNENLHKANGIDLWESHNNQISNTSISGVQDGIYVEKSHQNQLTHNRIQNSRYGIHLMYADQTHVENNVLQYNVTGAMMMVVNESTVRNNTFSQNKDHVYSQGLLLHEAYNSLVESNQFVQNRVGVYIESSSDNRMVHNQFTKNYIGFEWKRANQNTLEQNDFIANVIPSQATDSLDNNVQVNYWDDLEGLDSSGDGLSELAYSIDPYFLTITENFPAFQLLFQSPGITLLKQLFTSEEKQLLQDQSPSMSPHFSYEKTNTTSPILMGVWPMLLLFLSCSIFIMGRK